MVPPETPPGGHRSSYSEVELLVNEELVYLRSDSNVLTALVPTVRQLCLQPLQLAKGKPGSVPTAPLDPNSVWLVRRQQQVVMFELLGPQGRRHVLEADPGSPHGVALGGGRVLPHQVLPVQLVDARALGSVKAALGRQLAEMSSRAECEARERALAEARRDHLEAEVDDLRTRLEVAQRERQAAMREVAALDAQRTDAAMRAKAAQAKADAAESDAKHWAGAFRQLQGQLHQQLQGLMADHSLELSTLRQELQIARETNEGLQRAMKEQALSLHGELELRDARIIELEEENDRMDTVLQVIQAQLGGTTFSFPQPAAAIRQPSGSVPADAAIDLETTVGSGLDDGAARAPYAHTDEECSAPGGAAAADAEDEAEPDGAGDGAVSAMNPSASPHAEQGLGQAGPQPEEGAEELPLWRSLLKLPGGLTTTALKVRAWDAVDGTSVGM
ncbi:hypothetical protein GPECTOR_7g1095 [Gonium pectorale]|uniref:Uncharacterized protein n=1 Tax=Gonium pectorale TaxID=33097 RepID=A0A150GTZ0_GONPE|nr:hypothetical protein GPECTOR_7g1095 [Gonium pectorale]|eukprot:KXZ53202.1 hypothetical protein GPECTOR_7g1095 [Gonium pectorale]